MLLSSKKCQDRLRGPPNFLLTGCWGSFPGVKQTGCKIVHSYLSIAEVKEEQSYKFSPPIHLHSLYRDKNTVTFLPLPSSKYESERLVIIPEPSLRTTGSVIKSSTRSESLRTLRLRLKSHLLGVTPCCSLRYPEHLGAFDNIIAIPPAVSRHISHPRASFRPSLRSTRSVVSLRSVRVLVL